MGSDHIPITGEELEGMKDLSGQQFLLADRFCAANEAGESDLAAIEDFRLNSKEVGMLFPRCIAEIERLRAIIDRELSSEHDTACSWHFHPDHRMGCSCGRSAKCEAFALAYVS